MHSFRLFLGSFAVSALIVSMTGWLALRPWRRSVGMHWTERARILWPARMDVRHALMACGFLAGIWALFDAGRMHDRWLPLIMGAILGGALGSYPFERSIEPRHRFRSWLNAQMWGMFAWFMSTGIIILLMVFLPKKMEASDWWVAGAGLSVVVLMKMGLMLRIAASLSKPVPMDESLQAAIRRCEESTGVIPKRVWVAASPVANAFAMPVTREVMVTSRLMEELKPAELETVMRHEFAHLTEPRRVVWARVIRGLSWLPLAFLHPAQGWFGPGGMLVVFVVPVMMDRLGLKLAQRMEQRADRAAAESADDPAIYASALEKIYEVNQVPAVLPGQKHTHPHLYDRMVSAGVTPAYPRPLPPATYTAAGVAAMTVPVAIVVGRIIWLLKGNALAL